MNGRRQRNRQRIVTVVAGALAAFGMETCSTRLRAQQPGKTLVACGRQSERAADETALPGGQGLGDNSIGLRGR
jgi:hypothetical protein